jgi:hypothetical protein
MGFVGSFKKAFNVELDKKIRPHVKTALANALANWDIDVHSETLDDMTDDFFFYFKKSVESK